MHWKRDWRLLTRMGTSIGGLVALYVAFIVTLVHLSGYLWVFVAMFGGLAVAQYYYGESITLKSIGASKVDASTHPELHARISRLSQQATLPLPDIAVADIDAPNAFAIGRNQANATICVTTGLLDTLGGDELDAVLAHELTHVKNRDVMVLTLVSFLSTITYAIVRHAWFFDGGGGSGGGGDAGNHWLLAFSSSRSWRGWEAIC
jgi:heat shock protein HtpX